MEKFLLSDGILKCNISGGISNASDVIEYAEAGASFVQLYTSLGYYGPGLVMNIKQDLANELKQRGLTWSQLVGSGHIPKVTE